MRTVAKATTVYLIGYWVIGLAANILFKEGGTAAGHRLLYLVLGNVLGITSAHGQEAGRYVFYFVLGNAMGITSTWFLVRLYARMNVNLAMLLAVGGAFISFQVALWLIYQAQLTFLQCAGNVTVLAGMILTLWPGRPATSQAPIQNPSQEPSEKAML